MKQFVGLDASQDNTHVCVIGGDGKIVWQGTALQRRKGSQAPSKPMRQMRTALDSRTGRCRLRIGICIDIDIDAY